MYKILEQHHESFKSKKARAYFKAGIEKYYFWGIASNNYDKIKDTFEVSLLDVRARAVDLKEVVVGSFKKDLFK